MHHARSAESGTGSETLLTNDDTLGLGEILLHHPPGTFPVTPATRVSVRAIAASRSLIAGQGIDWGSGVGGLAIAAARIPAVTSVIGLELSEANVAAARENASQNGVQDRVAFFSSDSFAPLTELGRQRLTEVRGSVRFLLANPPSSDGDDGFGFRRLILSEARGHLAEGGLVLLSISSQYGPVRIHALSQDAPEYSHRGVAASTDWVPFDLTRDDLLHCLELYAEEELRGGPEYVFRHPGRAEGMNAQGALAWYRETGESPLSKWQAHLFEFRSAETTGRPSD